MPSIPNAPSRDEALSALEELKGLLHEFPVVDEASRSAALSALITPLARGACAVVPMHAATSPSAGTGKTLLWGVVSAIALGEPEMPAIAASDDYQEFAKRFDGALLRGSGLLSNNVTIPLRGDALCQGITAAVYAPRVLGSSSIKSLKNVWSIYSTATI